MGAAIFCTHTPLYRGTFRTLYFSSSPSVSQIENRRCAERCLIGNTCWKEALGMTEVSSLAHREPLILQKQQLHASGPAWGASSSTHTAVYLHHCMQVTRESAQVHCRDKLIVYSCTLHSQLAGLHSKYIYKKNENRQTQFHLVFHVWTKNYTYLTSFEMVMHCLKYPGKQSSTTNANMCSGFWSHNNNLFPQIQVVSVFSTSNKWIIPVNICCCDSIYVYN